LFNSTIIFSRVGLSIVSLFLLSRVIRVQTLIKIIIDNMNIIILIRHITHLFFSLTVGLLFSKFLYKSGHLSTKDIF